MQNYNPFSVIGQINLTALFFPLTNLFGKFLNCRFVKRFIYFHTDITILHNDEFLQFLKDFQREGEDLTDWNVFTILEEITSPETYCPKSYKGINVWQKKK